MEKQLIFEINRIQTMMFGNKKLLNEQGSIIGKFVKSSKKWLDDLISGGKVLEKGGVHKSYKVGAESITKTDGDEILKYLKGEIGSLTKSQEDILLRIFKNNFPTADPDTYNKFVDGLYSDLVLPILKTGNQSEDVFLKGMKKRIDNGESLDDILTDLGFDSEVLPFITKKMKEKLTKNIDPLDPLVYTGGKNIDDFMEGLSPIEKQRIKSAKLSEKQIDEWAKAAEKDVAFFSEFTATIFKSKEVLLQELDDISVAFKNTISSESFINMTDEAKEKIIKAYSTKFSSKLNSLQSKLPADATKKLLDSGVYPPEMVNFIKGAKDDDVLLYLKRFWKIRPEESVSYKSEIFDSLKQTWSDSLKIYSETITKFITTKGGVKTRFLASLNTLDPRSTLGSYFFTNQFLGIKRFTDFAIKKGIFRSGQTKMGMLKNYSTLLVMSFGGYCVFAICRTAVGMAIDTMKLIWNNLVDGKWLEEKGYTFNLSDFTNVENIGFFLGESAIQNLSEQFISMFDGDDESKSWIRKVIAAGFPSFGLTTIQNSLFSKLIFTLTGKEVNTAYELILNFIAGGTAGEFTDSKDEAEKELETETGEKLPTQEETNIKAVNDYKNRIFENLKSNYWRTIAYPELSYGAEPTEKEEENLKNKIFYDGESGTFDDKKFYVLLDGQKYYYRTDDRFIKPDGGEVEWEALGKKLYEKKIMNIDKKIILETLGFRKTQIKNFSNKKQNIILTESQLEKLLLKLKK
jgi:hypothetical protein